MEVLRKDEEQPTKYKPGGRLDMSHGFLHHIRRNQIARDDYDKEVKQAKEQQKRRHTSTPKRPRRPDMQVYHPRHRDGSETAAGVETEDWNDSGSSTETEAASKELFWLDYQADCGRLTSFIVHKEDKPERVVQKIAKNNVLDAAMKAVLQAWVEEEIDKRRDKR